MTGTSSPSSSRSRSCPRSRSTDALFLRRAYLDAIGRLPDPAEARAFLADDSARETRSKLVDRLVGRPEFADFWALKWADLLRNEEKTMGEKGVWVFQRWLRDQFAADVPLDEFARRLITAKGSTWSNPPASFYRTNRDPMTAAETIGQVFLGVRLQCARCHNHPFDVWTQNDYYGLAAFFGNVRQKEIDNVRRDNLDKHEINGDVIIYLSGEPETVQPRSGEMMVPKAPGGPKPNLHGDPDARDDLAGWLTVDNRQFARNMANRVWFHLLGRGIVDPVDDFRDSNPPSNPALLDALTDELRRQGVPAPPARRADHEVADLSARLRTERDERRRRGQLRPRRRPAPARPRSCSTPSARRSASPETFSNAPKGLRADAASRRSDGGTVPEGVRQARPAPDLRVRTLGIDDPGAGVPAHQRRRRPLEARGRRQPYRPLARFATRLTRRSSTS